jgi:hypothetical protein
MSIQLVWIHPFVGLRSQDTRINERLPGIWQDSKSIWGNPVTSAICLFVDHEETLHDESTLEQADRHGRVVHRIWAIRKMPELPSGLPTIATVLSRF